jgi:hypothetical protein
MSINREVGFCLGWGDEENELGVEAEFLNKMRFIEYWFRERFLNRNVRNLRDKMVALADELPPEAIQFVTASLPDFLNRAIVARNFLTHLDPKLKPRAEEGSGLKTISLKPGYFLSFHFCLNETPNDGILDLCQRPPKNARIPSRRQQSGLRARRHACHSGCSEGGRPRLRAGR